MKEIWKDITGYKGRYQVSNKGRVRSLDRIETWEVLGKERSFKIRGQLMKFGNQLNGYIGVTLANTVKSRRYMIHKLVAQEFIGPRPAGHTINHKNGVKDDNVSSNLEYSTHRANIHHARDTMGCYWGERNGKATLTDKQVAAVRARYAKGGITCSQLGVKYHVAKSTIARMVSGKTRNHVTR